MTYTVTAWWPNSTEEPYTRYVAHKADALDMCLRLVRLNRHTTISCVTDDAMELFRFWGMVKDYP